MAKTIKDTENIVAESFEKITDIANNIIDEKITVPVIEKTIDEAKEKAELEAKEKAELEAKEKAELEAKEKAELEAKEKSELEAKAKAELEAKAKAELEAKAKAELEAKAKAELEAKAKEETTEEVDVINEIIKLLKLEHNYSHLSCGRYLKENIDKKNLELFYNEFISYGISSKNDADVIKNIELLLKK